MILIAFYSALGLTVISLLAGLFCFFKGGDAYKQKANAFMRFRVVMQGVALLLFLIILWSR